MTEVSKHTPGPWMYRLAANSYGENGAFVVVREDGCDEQTLVCHMPYSGTNSNSVAERKANARLIAAAPELLECARNGWRMCNAMILAAEQAGNPLPENHYAVRDLPKFEAAIAKAEGRV